MAKMVNASRPGEDAETFFAADIYNIVLQRYYVQEDVFARPSDSFTDIAQRSGLSSKAVDKHICTRSQMIITALQLSELIVGTPIGTELPSKIRG